MKVRFERSTLLQCPCPDLFIARFQGQCGPRAAAGRLRLQFEFDRTQTQPPRCNLLSAPHSCLSLMIAFSGFKQKVWVSMQPPPTKANAASFSNVATPMQMRFGCCCESPPFLFLFLVLSLSLALLPSTAHPILQLCNAQLPTLPSTIRLSLPRTTRQRAPHRGLMSTHSTAEGCKMVICRT